MLELTPPPPPGASLSLICLVHRSVSFIDVSPPSTCLLHRSVSFIDLSPSSTCLLRQVSKVGDDEQDSFPAASIMRSMKPRQRSMGSLNTSDSGRSFEEDEEEEDGDD